MEHRRIKIKPRRLSDGFELDYGTKNKQVIRYCAKVILIDFVMLVC